MFRSRSTDAIYNKEYHEKFLERAKTDLGHKIYKSRWDLVQKHAPGHFTLLDYGCASGAFHLNSPNGYETMGYDINPATGFSKMPMALDIDILTMWDSFEHVHDPVGLIKRINPIWLFLSTPNLESVEGPIIEWKHYRPREHLYYFDRHSLGEILDHCGYNIEEINYEEGALRDPKCPKAIITIVAQKRS